MVLNNHDRRGRPRAKEWPYGFHLRWYHADLWRHRRSNQRTQRCMCILYFVKAVALFVRRFQFPSEKITNIEGQRIKPRYKTNTCDERWLTSRFVNGNLIKETYSLEEYRYEWGPSLWHALKEHSTGWRPPFQPQQGLINWRKQEFTSYACVLGCVASCGSNECSHVELILD